MKTILLFLLLIVAIHESKASDIMWMNHAQTGNVNPTDISDNGHYLAASYELIKDSVFIWDLWQKKIVKSLNIPAKTYKYISRDGKKLAVGKIDYNYGFVKIYDWASDSVVFSIDSIYASFAKFSADGDYISLGNYRTKKYKQGIAIYRLSDGKLISFKELSNIYTCEFSNDGALLATYNIQSNNSNYISFSNVVTGEIIRDVFLGNFQGSMLPLIRFTNDGNLIFFNNTGGGNLTLFTIDVNSGTIIDKYNWNSSGITSCHVINDNNTQMISTSYGKIKYYNNTSPNALDSFDLDMDVGIFQNRKDTNILALSCYDRIYLWDIKLHQITDTLQKINNNNHFLGINDVDISPEGKIAASASSDRTVKFWNAENGEYIKTLKGHKSGLTGVRYSPDGKHLMTYSGDYENVIKIWDTGTDSCLITFKHYNNRYFYTDWLDNSRIVVSDTNFYMYFVNAFNGYITDTIYYNNKLIRARIFAKSLNSEYLAFCSDNIYMLKNENGAYKDYISIPYPSSLAAISNDLKNVAFIPGSICAFYDLENNWALGYNLSPGHPDINGNWNDGYFNKLLYSNNSKFIITNEWEATKLWNAKNGTAVKLFNEYNRLNNRLGSNTAISRDDKKLISVFSDGTIQRWKTDDILDVNNHEEYDNISIYPNPVPDKLTLITNNIIIYKPIIFDIFGRELNLNMVNGSNDEIVLDCSRLARGIYFIRLNSGNKTENIKFIKK